jgi:hypothetical protein
MLNDRRLRGTFFVVGSDVEAWWAQSRRLHIVELLDMARDGHEIGSHTYSHPDLRTLTDAQIRQEMEQSLQYLARYGIKVASMAYPFGASDDRVRAIVAQYVEFARGGKPVVMSPNWVEVNALDLGLLSGSDHYSSLQAASLQQGWAIDVFHHIGEGYLSEADFERLVDTLVSLRDSHQLWVDTLANVATYIRERAFAQLKSKTTNDGNTIIVTLGVDSECPSPLIPLTVQTEISGMYVKSINQAGRPIGFRISETGEQRFVIYDVLPNAGPAYVELTNVSGLQAMNCPGSSDITHILTVSMRSSCLPLRSVGVSGLSVDRTFKEFVSRSMP